MQVILVGGCGMIRELTEEEKLLKKIERKKKARFKEYEEAFKEIDKDKMKLLSKTIQFAIDLEFKLDKLRVLVDETGFIETYKNGDNQYGKKESSAGKAYNSALKNYNLLIKTILGELPDHIKAEDDDGFDEFLKTMAR
ncbi:hypothetical protein [Veillonella sp.]|uniref:hypothetical protein n=1 Tax=Veillonella sp. TaxID=1926307 RepID=UPI0025FC3099|nr:hypothetical protein [Veillonella sp.]